MVNFSNIKKSGYTPSYNTFLKLYKYMLYQNSGRDPPLHQHPPILLSPRNFIPRHSCMMDCVNNVKSKNRWIRAINSLQLHISLRTHKRKDKEKEEGEGRRGDKGWVEGCWKVMVEVGIWRGSRLEEEKVCMDLGVLAKFWVFLLSFVV